MLTQYIKCAGSQLGRVAIPLMSWMCYKREAVKDTWKQQTTPATAWGQPVAEPVEMLAVAEKTAVWELEDHSRFCPVCSQRLESRRCKLICNVCGYYMSCADYY